MHRLRRSQRVLAGAFVGVAAGIVLGSTLLVVAALWVAAFAALAGLAGAHVPQEPDADEGDPVSRLRR